MAESCVDSAPRVFYCTSVNESAPGLMVAVERCPLCGKTNSPFFCQSCVSRGCFLHSKLTYTESFAEKQKRWEKLKKLRSLILEGFLKSVTPIHECDEKETTIKECNKKIELMQGALIAANSNLVKEKKAFEKQKQENLEKVSKAKKHVVKKRRILDYNEESKIRIKQKEEEAQNQQEFLHKKRLSFVHNLMQYIFPIEEVNPNSDGDSKKDSLRALLKDACQTAYIRGRWVYGINDMDMKYKIVDPVLPSNGDYSQFSVWLASKRESGVIQTEPNPRSNALDIIAGLCHTAQLVSLLSYILRVNLPKRLCYSEFMSNNLTDQHYNSAVSRLNQNVLYLCFSQGVDSLSLEPKHTVQNIVILLKSPMLGRVSSFEVNEEMMQSVEDLESQSDDSEDDYYKNVRCVEVDCTHDWEQVPIEIPEFSIPSQSDVTSTGSEQSMAYTSQTLSESTLSASGLVSSAAASFAYFFKAATGQSDKR
ncbi:hypothetical protein CHS0354_001491 [Potamilus streckersoni]|uniref:Beclin 1-associated autophagy-related key regulator n=1 Tax=Potamilus streckersoni TaxID=2493646 RepID=A0AAE0RVI6_9BIVA|nr:hypothetical protein CHS0354_001491 [Potamilus streckersoni]